MFKFERTLNTNGKGIWTQKQKPVKTLRVTVDYINDEQDFGELRVHFDTKSWNVKKNNFIYTDPLFLKELREELDMAGLPGDDADYSEHGMQGDDYVSLDVGEDFINAWQKMVDKTVPAL